KSAETIAEMLDERGVSLRITTTRHTMAFSATCLAEDFDDVLNLVIEVARYPVFPDLEVAKRRGESITVLRQDEDNPAVRAVEMLSEMLYGSAHPYGRRAKGSIESLERIDRASIARFHSAHVRPAVLSLAIVGDVASSRAIDRAAELFADWKGVPAG